MSEPTKVELKPEDFVKAYQELCEKMGFRIVVSPQYIARDDGSFSTILQHTVGKVPEKTT